MAASYFQTLTLDAVPDLLALHASQPRRYPHLLASTAQGNALARYDILFACPRDSLLLDGAGDFLAQLDARFATQAMPAQSSELPFYGGWFLYLGYELAGQIEPGLQLPAARDGLPLAMATRFPAAIIVDHQQQSACIVCENESAALLEQINADLQRLAGFDVRAYQQPIRIDALQEDDEQVYLQQVAKLKRYIVDGDVFQVNLSRAWKTRLLAPVNHASLFWHLGRNNPGPFNALVSLDEQHAVISSSPERLVEVRQGQVQTRPIAGTRPRSASHEADLALSDELLRHPKERAEHIMLIDLERNDLGRICRPGSVQVSELMALESYQHVHHIVSNVRGRLKEKVSPGDIIKAVFPGGTITGCPKVRCMEILAELEQTGRGAYTGSLGYLNRDGSMDLNILIRTMVRNHDELRFRAGGGIVADSDAQHELAETRAKAKGLIMALTG
jgi:anthranilate synthase component 1